VHDVADASALLADRRRILVYTGAGISTESGIPDFRGPSGIWKTADPADFTLQRYLTDEGFRRDTWQRKFDSNAITRAEPNPAHHALVRLWKAHRMVGVVTQNIDGLHQAAGLPAEAVAELHGSAHGIVCLDCGDHPEWEAIEARWRAGEEDPACARCGGMLKSTMVLFGEVLPEEEFARASLWAAMADAALAIGTTLGVYPAAEIPLQVAARGDPFVIINQGPTEHDLLATVRLEGTAGVLVPALVSALIGS
jgi:NAD-dependent deacetylase